MFHRHGYEFNAYLYENKVKAKMNCFIRKDLDAWKKPAEITLITDAHVVTHWYEVESFEEGFVSECEELAKHPFDPAKAREERIEAIKHHTQYLRCEFEKPGYRKAVKAAHAKEIDIEIPLDPRFID